MYYDPQLRIGVFGCSRQGASHKRSEPPTPCQDAFHFSSGTLAGQSYLVAAVADGHGDKKYERSTIGSHLAAQAAYNVFLRFLWSKDGNTPFNETGEDKSSIVRSFRADFASGLHKEWKFLVEEHLKSFPHSLSSPVPYQLYGTTLLFAAVIENVVLLAKIGDGDIVILKKDGSYEVPEEFAEDRKQVGGITDSLCAPDAAKKIKTCVRSGADYILTLKAITLSTDGLSNAVETDDEFCTLLSQIIKRITANPDATHIAPVLDHFSQAGSGDDVTILGLCFGESVIETPQKTPEVQQASDVAQPPVQTQSVTQENLASDNAATDSAVGATYDAMASRVNQLPLTVPPLELQSPQNTATSAKVKTEAGINAVE